MAKSDKSDTIKKEFIKTLRSKEASGNVSVTCKLIGISRDTAYRYRRSDDNFAKRWGKAVKRGRRMLADEAEFKLREAVQSGNITAIIFTLKSYRPSVYKEKFEHTGKGEEPIQVSMPGVEKWLREKIKNAKVNKK